MTALTKRTTRDSGIFRTRLRCTAMRSEEHTSELQSRLHLVCRLLLEKKNTQPHALQRILLLVPSDLNPLCQCQHPRTRDTTQNSLGGLPPHTLPHHYVPPILARFIDV